jgi:haloalkane dehalogenase
MFHLLSSARRSITTRCGEIGYLDRGDGPVALFVHGISTNALLWRNVIELLSPSSGPRHA